MTNQLYANYFNIDPDFTPVVDDKLIEQKPDLWKSYYPHETFINLIKSTVRVLSRRDKKSLWVEGAYGSGKSHAVLTLKKLLEADENNTKEYFEKYSLEKELFDNFQQEKSDGKILTVHRYGSANIKNDYQLAVAIQESIQNSLIENGFTNFSKGVLKNEIIKWIEDETNKPYFNSIIVNSSLFSGETADSIINKLKTYSEIDIPPLVDKIFKVTEDRGIKAFRLEIDTLVNWIEALIEENKLKAIVFVWDEFTEYFKNNVRSLTGFQRIAEISATTPFYLTIVTHLSTALFESNSDAKKIVDRFVRPGEITLPENIAFDLMAHAMKKNEDPVIYKAWQDIVSDLYARTPDSREIVNKIAKTKDKQLEKILPIHPYTALLLKHISAAFGSNQRSMFEFIGKDSSDNSKAFQWFIENNGPFDSEPLLTIDMLWDYFYEKGRDSLSPEIRTILDCYTPSVTTNLRNDQKRVFKTILLLQAISQRVGDSVEFLIPDEKNIDRAFEGSENISRASSIAEGLLRDNIIYKKHIGNNKYQYSVLTTITDTKTIDKHKEEVKRTSTTELINKSNILENIELLNSIKLRFSFEIATDYNFDTLIKKYKNNLFEEEKFIAIYTFAKNDYERSSIQQKIYNFINSDDYNENLIFIDMSNTTFPSSLYDEYIENMANSIYQRNKDKAQEKSYFDTASKILNKWTEQIIKGAITVYSIYNLDGNKVDGNEELNLALVQIIKEKYPFALDVNYKLTETMFLSTSLASGAECGILQETKGQYKSGNPNTKLENALVGAWGVDEYWTKPENSNLLITKIKKRVDEIITKTFETENKVSITKIYDTLRSKPFGFVPCNITSFVLGFVLKEYTNGKYMWSDNISNDEMSVNKLKEMIENILKNIQNPSLKYRESYIATETEEIREFNTATSEIFSIDKKQCSSVEHTRDSLRRKMVDLSFPIIYLKNILEKENLSTNVDILKNLIDKYSLFVNNDTNNFSDNDIAKEIGTLCLNYPSLIIDLKNIVNDEKLKDAMQIFLTSYKDGELLSLAEAINDNGQYINKLREKYKRTDASTWVWKSDTAESVIDDIILDYQIIRESNKYISPANDFITLINNWNDTVSQIKISYFSLKGNVENLDELLSILYELKKNCELKQHQKYKFLQLLQLYGNDFKSFYCDQIRTFTKVCQFILFGLSTEDINKIYSKIPYDVFLDEKNIYTTKVQENVETYKTNLSSQKIKNIWKEKTGTLSPNEWSIKYGVPILFMFDDDELIIAGTAFDVLNKNNPSKESVEKAITFIENGTFYERLGNEKYRDEIFRKRIMKDYSVIIDDINEVKILLKERVDDNPYNWSLKYNQIDTIMKDFAQSKYNNNGYNEALKTIETMNSDEVKKYLSALIKDNMTVGLQIIKSQK